MIRRLRTRRRTARQPGAPWAAVLDAADSRQWAFRRLVLDWADHAQAALDERALVHAIQTGNEAEGELAARTALARARLFLLTRTSDLILSTMGAGAGAALKNFRRRESFVVARVRRKPALIPLDFNLSNPRAVAWARTRAGELITGLEEETRAAILKEIRRIIARSQFEGIPVARVARMIRDEIGLTERLADAVRRLAAEILANPGRKLWAGNMAIRVPARVTWDFIARRTAQYARRLLNFRARMIARTETLAASNMGQVELWRQALAQGLLRGDEFKVWITTPDERLCSECEQLEGEEVPFDSDFSTGDMAPPLHPNCRCTIGLTAGRGRKAA